MRIFLFALTLIIIQMWAFGQRPTMELTFTAVDSTGYVQLDSINIMNRTQGGDTLLYWPDTVLTFNYVGIEEPVHISKGFQVFQNYPNPVAELTTVSLYVPEKDKVSIAVTDILGRIIVRSERMLDHGKHSFRFRPGGANLYFFTARWKGNSSSIKILNMSAGNNPSSLDYLRGESSDADLKATEESQKFGFSPGDKLLYIGYADILQSGILDSPAENSTYTFQFATNIPCPGTPTVEYEGQVFNTIQVFSQCWLKENLNVGVMISGSQNQSNNGTIEKYCYYNLPDSCTKYGGLYFWDEMMQYSTTPSAQGICPPGWHLPTDEEWKVLEGAVDSQYGIGDPEWDISEAGRGYDAGMNLKTTTGWNSGSNGTDLFGFSGLPGGFCFDYELFFYGVGHEGSWWSSSERDNVHSWQRTYIHDSPRAGRFHFGKSFGLSVRCLKD